MTILTVNRDLQRLSLNILELGATSFIDVAILAPELWRTVSHPATRRSVAEILGWPITITTARFERVGLFDFVALFMNNGVSTVNEAWRWLPNACEYLRRSGWLDEMFVRVGLSDEGDFPDDIDFYRQRCLRAGSFEAWRDIEPAAFRAALVHGYLADLADKVPQRPATGYPTTGGNVRTTAELIVARILETAGVAFKANRLLHSSPREPGWGHHPVDFMVEDSNIFVIITDGQNRDNRRRVRGFRRACRGARARIVMLHGSLLQGAGGVAAFYAHVRIALGEAEIVPESLNIDLWRCLSPDTVGEPGGDDRSGR